MYSSNSIAQYHPLMQLTTKLIALHGIETPVQIYGNEVGLTNKTIVKFGILNI